MTQAPKHLYWMIFVLNTTFIVDAKLSILLYPTSPTCISPNHPCSIWIGIHGIPFVLNLTLKLWSLPWRLCSTRTKLSTSSNCCNAWPAWEVHDCKPIQPPSNLGCQWNTSHTNKSNLLLYWPANLHLYWVSSSHALFLSSARMSLNHANSVCGIDPFGTRHVTLWKIPLWVSTVFSMCSVCPSLMGIYLYGSLTNLILLTVSGISKYIHICCSFRHVSKLKLYPVITIKD